MSVRGLGRIGGGVGTGALRRGAETGGTMGMGACGGWGRGPARRRGGMGGGSKSGSPAIPPEGAWVTRSCLLRERRRGGTRGWASSTAGRNPSSPYCLRMFCFRMRS